MLEKKSEPPAGIEPTTFHILVGRSNNLAMVDSHGEQVADLGVTTVGFVSRAYAGLSFLSHQFMLIIPSNPTAGNRKTTKTT